MNLSAQTYRRVRSILHFGTEVLGKIPRRGDGFLDVIAKLLAVADAAEKSFGGKSTVYADVFERFDLRERTSETFVRLFFNAGGAARFKLRRHGVNDNLELIEAEAQDGERLFFQEHRYGKPEISSEFFHTPNFDFGRVTDTLWDRFPHGLYLSVKEGRWTNEVTFSPLHPPRGTVTSQKAQTRILEGAIALRERGPTPWCFLAYGPPGTGKTAYVSALARETGGRLLMIDATALPQLGVQEVGFLLDALEPDVLLVDDFDRAPVEAARARVLFLFQHLGAARRGVTVGVTVNDAAKIDEALLRSERIEEAIEFPLPDAAERSDVLGQLLEQHDLMAEGKIFDLGEDAAIRNIDALIKNTEGFNHADLGGLVGRLRRGETVEAALGAMKRLRALAAKAAEEKASTPSEPEQMKPMSG